MRKNEVTLKEALMAAISSKNIKQPYNQSRIEKVWQEKMGPTINEYTSGVKLKAGVLYLRITSSALKNEITYAKSSLIETLNKHMGEQVIRDIVIL